MKDKRTCLSLKERYIIEHELKHGRTPRQISEELNRALSCIYAEIKRGTVIQLRSDLTEYKTYLADYAQMVHERNCQSRGVGLAIGNDIQLAKRLETLILDNGYSAYSALQIAKQEGYNVTFKLSTLYNYIRNGVFHTLNKKHLRKYKTEKKKQIVTKKVIHGKSIETRNKDILKRQDFGHWEMDTVVGRQGTTTCLLVLTERKTRYEIIRKMAHKSVDCTLAELDNLEKEYGEKFKEIFKTVTSDNGVEFLGGGILEKSINGGKRFEHYYCHPYASNERGSNENQNRFIRRFVKKGSDIAYVTNSEIQYIENYINTYPRKLFDGKTAKDMWLVEMGFS